MACDASRCCSRSRTLFPDLIYTWKETAKFGGRSTRCATCQTPRGSFTRGIHIVHCGRRKTKQQAAPITWQPESLHRSPPQKEIDSYLTFNYVSSSWLQYLTRQNTRGCKLVPPTILHHPDFCLYPMIITG